MKERKKERKKERERERKRLWSSDDDGKGKIRCYKTFFGQKSFFKNCPFPGPGIHLYDNLTDAKAMDKPKCLVAHSWPLFIYFRLYSQQA